MITVNVADTFTSHIEPPKSHLYHHWQDRNRCINPAETIIYNNISIIMQMQYIGKCVNVSLTKKKINLNTDTVREKIDIEISSQLHHFLAPLYYIGYHFDEYVQMFTELYKSFLKRKKWWLQEDTYYCIISKGCSKKNVDEIKKKIMLHIAQIRKLLLN